MHTKTRVAVFALYMSVACAWFLGGGGDPPEITTKTNKKLIDDHERKFTGLTNKNARDVDKNARDVSLLGNNLQQLQKNINSLERELQSLGIETKHQGLSLREIQHKEYIKEHGDSPESKVIQIFDYATEFLDDALNPLLQQGWSVGAGLLLVILAYIRVGVWLHRKKSCCGRPSLAMRSLGVDLMILGVYTVDKISSYKYMTSTSLIIFDWWFFTKFDKWAVSKHLKNLREVKETEQIDDGDERDELLHMSKLFKQHLDTVHEKKKATNVYQDLTRPLWEVIPFFLMQVVVMGYLADSFLEDSDMHKLSGHVKVMRWLAAVLVQITCGEALAGQNNSSIWYTFLGKPDFDLKQETAELEQRVTGHLDSFKLLGMRQKRVWGTWGRCGIRVSLKKQWYIRYVFDAAINGLGRHQILFTIPIMLCSAAQAMDFVLNCTAVFFILTLDDIPAVPLAELSLTLKFDEFLKERESDRHANPRDFQLTDDEMIYANQKRSVEKFDRFEEYFKETWHMFKGWGQEDEAEDMKKRYQRRVTAEKLWSDMP